MAHTRVLVVEDHNLVREALRALIEENPSLEVIGQAQDGNEALSLAEQVRPDLVIMDIMMPNLNGFEATKRMSSLARPPKIVILSQHNKEEYVLQALVSGASGYLLKDAAADELLQAIKAVSAGETYFSTQLDRESIEERLRQRSSFSSPMETLTPREREVLQLVAEGNTNRQVAIHLGISIKTVEKHRFSLMEKLNIRDVTGLVRFAVAHGIIPSDKA
jgi:RNA polymerase sigma factor (sigma-70 family)